MDTRKITIVNISTRRIRIIVGRSQFRFNPNQQLKIDPNNKTQKRLLQIVEDHYNGEFLINEKEKESNKEGLK